ncbi:hypothetical protein BpHYR1_012389 [Brachionus plicatilis]|uniref:Uncharacterized protein n=1 Tax=Brachionus plicatilis TaxID=10195 RepID=A0A3M7R813_BRAPC|nr:hypothetical protein BpHYR1_012389 [Brachionus plicatilis]
MNHSKHNLAKIIAIEFKLNNCTKFQQGKTRYFRKMPIKFPGGASTRTSKAQHMQQPAHQQHPAQHLNSLIVHNMELESTLISTANSHTSFDKITFKSIEKLFIIGISKSIFIYSKPGGQPGIAMGRFIHSFAESGSCVTGRLFILFQNLFFSSSLHILSNAKILPEKIRAEF